MSERASPPPVLVVAGMHRSGTSFAASLLHAAGIDMGERLLGADPTNPRGHFEDLDVLGFHQRLLTAHGFADHGIIDRDVGDPEPVFRAEAEALVAARRGRGRPWGWKDPRTVLFLDFWAALVPEARFLVVFRPPADVVDSLYRRGDAVIAANPPMALRAWLHANTILLDFAGRHPDRVLVREVSQLASDPEATLAVLRERFGLAPADAPTTFAPELLRAADADRAAFLRASCPESVDLLTELRRLAGAPPDDPLAAPATMADVLGSGLRAWHETRVLQRTLAGRTAEVAAQSARATAAEARLALADARLAAGDARLAALEQARLDVAAELATARVAIAAHAAALDEARRQLELERRTTAQAAAEAAEAATRTSDALAAARRDADVAAAEMAAVHTRARAAEAALSAANERANDVRTEHDKARAELADLHGQVRRLTDDLRHRDRRLEALAADHSEERAAAAGATAALHRELDEQRHETATERAAGAARIAALEATVQDLVGSTSWRLTAPARTAVEALRTAMRRSGVRGRAARAAGRIAAATRFVARRLASPTTALRSLTRAVEIVRSRGLSGLVRALSAAQAVEAARPPRPAAARRGVVRMPRGQAVTPPARSRERDATPGPTVSVLLPVFDTPAAVLEATLRSILAQTYPRLDVVAVDDASSSAHVPEILARHAARDPRLRVHRRAVNGGIATATNDALARATGDVLALVDHDDLLEPDALERCVEALRATGADAVYSDQDTIDAAGHHVWTFHKPDWSPEYLRHVMYVGHLLVVRRALAADVGGFDPAFDGVQDYEFMLRLGERTNHIAHVPEVLYHWRAGSGSLAAATDAKPGIDRLQARAVQAHLDRLGVSATATPHPRFPHRCVVTPKLEHFPTVSIVIPTKDRPELVGPCLESIFKRTRYPDVEVVAVDTGTTDPRALTILREHPVTVVPFTRPFNFSAAVNAGAAAARGEILVFLNNDTTVVSPDWLEHLVFHLAADDVGAVGPLLVYPDGSVQHAGVVLGARGTADHVMRRFPADADGYAGSLSCPREVSAVTGACLAIRRDVLQRVGGWNELYATHYQDVDLCLRLGRAGLRCLFTPDVRLVHHESPSRGDRYDFLDRLLLVDTWRDVLAAGDPAYPAACSLERLDYSPRDAVAEAARAS